MRADRQRVLQSLQSPTEGFLSVLERLNGADRNDDFGRSPEEDAQ